MDFLLAILPIGILIYVMTKRNSWPSHVSLPFDAFSIDPDIDYLGGYPAVANDAEFGSRTDHRPMA